MTAVRQDMPSITQRGWSDLGQRGPASFFAIAVVQRRAGDPGRQATANLDSGHGREIARVLRELASEDGRTVVIVSHDQRLEEIADRVLWLEDGVFRELAAMATDPVCQMAVESGDEFHIERDGEVFWFCSAYCRDEFRSDDATQTRTK